MSRFLAMIRRALLTVVIILATVAGAAACALTDNDLKALSAGTLGVHRNS